MNNTEPTKQQEGVRKYRKLPLPQPEPVHEAILVTKENVEEVAEWAGFKFIKYTHNVNDEEQAYFQSKKYSNVGHAVTLGTWLIDGGQTMDDKKFREEFQEL